MLIRRNILFCDYYEEWLKLYKEGSIRPVTMKKYELTLKWLRKLIPNLRIKQLDRAQYQKLINLYAEAHEKQTTMDFHRQVKAAIIDAMDEGLIQKDPTRKVIIKGKMPTAKKQKFLSLLETQKLVKELKLGQSINSDWLIYLILKTGLRFSEAIALTPSDFNFRKSTLSINKTWNYKNGGGFDLTKNESSRRIIVIDRKLNNQLESLCKSLPPDKPIFIGETGNVFNSTVNSTLARRCKKAGITTITVHGLRHTHASILLYRGVSLLSVSQRLGHSNVATTQKVYLHIILELENKDKDIMLKLLEKM